MQSRADNGEQAMPDLLTQLEGLSQKHETILFKRICCIAPTTMQIPSDLESDMTLLDEMAAVTLALILALPCELDEHRHYI